MTSRVRHNEVLAETLRRSITEMLSDEELQSFTRMPAEDTESLPAENLSYLDMDSNAPVKPIGSNWEVYEDPQRFERTYEFDNHQDLSSFLSTALEVRHDFNQAAWLSLNTQAIPGAFLVEAEVWNGGSPLGEDERLLTQILDEVYEGLFEEVGEAGLTVLDEDEYEIY